MPIADSEPAEVSEPRKQALYLPTSLVLPQGSPVLGHVLAVFAVGLSSFDLVEIDKNVENIALPTRECRMKKINLEYMNEIPLHWKMLIKKS